MASVLNRKTVTELIHQQSFDLLSLKLLPVLVTISVQQVVVRARVTKLCLPTSVVLEDDKDHRQ